MFHYIFHQKKSLVMPIFPRLGYVNIFCPLYGISNRTKGFFYIYVKYTKKYTKKKRHKERWALNQSVEEKENDKGWVVWLRKKMKQDEVCRKEVKWGRMRGVEKKEDEAGRGV